jgi:mono/diheme cytochrome c family protein
MAIADECPHNRIKPLVTLTLIVAVVAFGASALPYQEKAKGEGPEPIGAGNGIGKIQRDDAGARAAFLEAYKVLMHPRCLNCHPAGDVPLQGDDSHLHPQNVRRGPDGKGLYALKCANCHQLANLPGANMPPGNPNWHLPTAEMPLVFQGKTPGELARQLKDPKQNGNKTLEQLLHHVSEDKLVLGGWDPGDGRTKPPLSHAEFVRKMRERIEKGADSPE